MIKGNEIRQEYEVPLNNFPEESQESIDELLMKVYEKNVDLISLYARTIQTAQMSAFISAVIAFVMLAIRLCPFASFYYSFLLIPGLIAVFSLIITMNIYLIMKDLIESAQRIQQASSSGTIISYLCLNVIGIDSVIFFLLIFLKFDRFIESQWLSVFIPFFIGCCTAMFFVVFISPAFCQSQLYLEIAVMSIDIISIFSFGLLLSFKIDNNSAFSFGLTAIPLYFALGLHAISLCFSFIHKRTHLISSLLMLFSLLFFLLTLIVLHLKQDLIVPNVNNWLEVLLGLIGFTCLFAESIYSLFFEQDNLDFKAE